MRYITILGCDPGKVNYGYAVVRVGLDMPFRYKVLETGMIVNRIDDLTGDSKALVDKHVAEMTGLVAKYKVDVIVAERFQSRGLKGNLSELVNMMLCCLYFLPVKDVTVITASTWKNAFNRKQDLKAFYKAVKLVPHRIDATCIALFGASLYLAVEHFTFLQNLDLFKTRLEKTKETYGKDHAQPNTQSRRKRTPKRRTRKSTRTPVRLR